MDGRERPTCEVSLATGYCVVLFLLTEGQVDGSRRAVKWEYPQTKQGFLHTCGEIFSR